MWFVFPQVEGLGRSEAARLYAIGSLAEARGYLDHDQLGPRLHEATALALGRRERSLRAIFGTPDDMKFRSSMTLFDRARPGTAFGEALDVWCGGEGDPATLQRLEPSWSANGSLDDRSFGDRSFGDNRSDDG